MAWLGGCGSGGSKYTLHTVMLQIDVDEKALAAKLQDPPAALKALESMRRWASDAAFEAYLGSAAFQGDPGPFRELHGLFLTRLDATHAAASAGDTAALQARYLELRMACELCHAQYRPTPR